jgi:acylphosphatase
MGWVEPEQENGGGQSGPEASALRIKISGRVQGVGFRYSCYAEASRLGLGGWVRNTPEGGVEVWLESPDKGRLETMLRWLRHGPPQARVDHLHCDRARPTGACRGFSIEP